MNILGFNVGAVDLISYGGAAAVCGFLIWRDAARRKGLHEAGAAAGLAPAAQDVEDIPEFTLAPAGLGDAFLGLFGGRDIDFAQEPKFSKDYLLRGPDPDAIGRLFGRGAARCLGENPGWTVQGRGEWIVYYRDERTVAPEDLTRFLWEAKAVHSSFFGG